MNTETANILMFLFIALIPLILVTVYAIEDKIIKMQSQLDYLSKLLQEVYRNVIK